MMADNQGMDIAEGVLDTIVALSLRNIKGIACVGQPVTGFKAFFQPKSETSGVEVTKTGPSTVEVKVVLTVLDGYSMNQIADEVRSTIADAVLSQTGLTVTRVDISVESILFVD